MRILNIFRKKKVEYPVVNPVEKAVGEMIKSLAIIGLSEAQLDESMDMLVNKIYPGHHIHANPKKKHDTSY